MKKIILFLTLVSLQMLAMAQWSVGVHGGMSNTTITRSQADRIDETYGSLPGFDAGIEGRHCVTDWLSLRCGVTVMQRNHRLQRHLNYLSPVYTDHLNTYLTLPVVADFSFGGTRLRGHLLIGGFAGFWMQQRVKGTTYGMTDYDVFFNPFDQQVAFAEHNRRFDAGTVGGIGLSYAITSSLALNIDALLYYDLVSHHKGYPNLQDYRYLNTTTLTLGLTYHIPKTNQQ